VDAALMMFNAESNSRDSAQYQDKIALTEDKLAHTQDVQMELSYEIQELNKQNRELSDRILQLTTALARQERLCQDAEGEVEALTGHFQQLTQAYNTAAEELAHASMEAESRRALEALVAEMVEKNHSLEERMQTLNSIEQQAKIVSIERQEKFLKVLYIVTSYGKYARALTFQNKNEF